MSQIKVKAFAVLLEESRGRHLVWRGRDSTKSPTDFHRLLGGHEVVFGYTGCLADPQVVGPDGAWMADDGLPIWVEWRPLDDSGLDVPLYPDGLRELLAGLGPRDAVAQP